MANMATMCVMENCTDGGIMYEIVSEEIWSPWNAALNYFEYQPWFFSLIGSLVVGLSGIFPLFIIPIDQDFDMKHGESAGMLKLLLSFAVGTLLGNVFLHLLPEAWANKSLNQSSEDGHASMAVGLWVLGGFLMFVIVEKLFSGLALNKDDDDDDNDDDDDDDDDEYEEDEDDVKKGIKEEKEVEEKKEIDDSEGQGSSSISNPRTKDIESLNNNNDKFQKELENNNCLMPNGNVKNGCVKSSMMMNGISKDISMTMNGNCCVMTNNCGKSLYGRKNDDQRSVNVGMKIKENSSYVAKLRPDIIGVVSSDNVEEKSGGCFKSTTTTTKDEIIKKKIASSKRDEPTTRQLAKLKEKKEKAKHITGYLNLLANSIDNFTHGLAVGGAFMVSFRLGVFTTFAILIHEIPHEIGDFAILLRSGFSRWQAAKAQLITAGGGILGAIAAVSFSGGSVEVRTSWILPFTAGGFLHIGMVTILPELLQETNTKESVKQLAALFLGIALMAVMIAVWD